ncbi:unnamed protein product [Rotaria sordida]|uniref:Uncharacterized protein n=1 Tax=Rotaria sordida TaxID=392033 RepID=A0A819WN12_9BILA|nr:unnamed protein product [Rotaria sordida]CAF4129232.1 unnamed protein product [Rotaria sordida]
MPAYISEILDKLSQSSIQQINYQQNQITTTMTDALTRPFENIKSFDSTLQGDLRDWCDRAEIILNAFNINDDDRLTRDGINLEDAAFYWYRDNQGL